MAGLSIEDWIEWTKIRRSDEELLTDEEVIRASEAYFKKENTDKDFIDKLRAMKFTDFEIGYVLALCDDADEKAYMGPIKNIRDGIWYGWISLQVKIRSMLHGD